MNDTTTATDGEDALATTAEVASLFGCSERAVRSLTERGVIYAASPGTYPRDATIRDYIAHLRERAAGRETAVTAQRARLAAAQAERAERENEIALRRLVPADEIVRAWSQSIQHARARLLQIPRACAPLCLNRRSVEIEELLRDAIHGALYELAQTEFEADPEMGRDCPGALP